MASPEVRTGPSVTQVRKKVHNTRPPDGALCMDVFSHVLPLAFDHCATFVCLQMTGIYTGGIEGASEVRYAACGWIPAYGLSQIQPNPTPGQGGRPVRVRTPPPSTPLQTSKSSRTCLSSLRDFGEDCKCRGKNFCRSSGRG